MIDESATCKGLVDLPVKVVPVGADEEGKVPAKFPVYLPGEKDH